MESTNHATIDNFKESLHQYFLYISTYAPGGPC